MVIKILQILCATSNSILHLLDWSNKFEDAFRHRLHLMYDWTPCRIIVESTIPVPHFSMGWWTVRFTYLGNRLIGHRLVLQRPKFNTGQQFDDRLTFIVHVGYEQVSFIMFYFFYIYNFFYFLCIWYKSQLYETNL